MATSTSQSRSEKIKTTKAKKAEEAKLEEAARAKASALKKLTDKKELYLNPTRIFKVGDEVQSLTAYWKKVIVKEVVDDMFYWVEYSATNNNYGRPEDYTSYMFLPWNELRLVSAPLATQDFNEREKSIDNYISFGNRSLSDLFSKYYFFGVDDKPDYQRDLIWNLEDKVALIDSIFKGIEIGKFVFISKDFKDNEPCYEILDGKQRLNAIVEFAQDRFPYKGFYYSQLTLKDRRYFDGFNATIGETRGELTPVQKYEYFLRLNTRGKEQSKEHLKKVEELLLKAKEK